MIRKIANDDYEAAEIIALTAGKKALAKEPWLFNRTHPKSKGFFFELKINNIVHPKYYAVHCVDGVGTKLFVTAWSGNYFLQSTDAIAMNANDMATAIHAMPDCVNLYIACQKSIEEEHMGQIMGGFANALKQIRIPNSPFDVNIAKMETASLDEMVSLGVKGKGWDVGVVMTGFIEINKVPNLNPKPGHIIVGVSSTGLHSNGFTGARHVLLTSDVDYREQWKGLYTGEFQLNDRPPILQGQSILEALQVPTALYLVEAALIGQQLNNRDIYGINITGNGAANFNRVGENVSFEITDPMKMHPIQELLIRESGWTPKQAYTKQNMGMGFAYIAPDLETAERMVRIINQRGENIAQIVGEVKKSNKKELITTIHKPYEGKRISFVGYNN